MQLDLVAERFQTAGIASLVFDHRHFGASDGLPRQEVKPTRQSEDYHEAVTFLTNTPEVDASKIAAWGYSLSGGCAIKAAAVDRRIKAVVTVCPVLSTTKTMRRQIPPYLRPQRDASIFAERASRIRGDDVSYGTVASSDPTVAAFFTAPEAVEWFLSMQKTKAPAWENRYTLHSVFELVSYNPEGFIEALCPTPWLLIQGNADHSCLSDVNMEIYRKALEPKETMMFEGGHFDPLMGQVLEKIMATKIDFLKRKLDL